MIDKMIKRNGVDVMITKRTLVKNKYDDDEITSTSTVSTKGIVSNPDESGSVEHQGRSFQVDAEIILPSDVDVSIVGEGAPDKITFAYDGEDRDFRPIGRRPIKHPYNKLEKQTIQLSRVKPGANVKES